MMKFSIFHENLEIKVPEKFMFEELLMKEISRINYKRSDLLYEFPAETRLTVYRRLDIPNRGELASPWPREDL